MSAALSIACLRFDVTGLGDSEGEFGRAGFATDVADLVAVGDRVLKGTGPGTGLPAAFLVRPRPDLSGVVVEMERTDLTQSQFADLEGLAGVPVTVEPGEPLRPQ